MTHIPTEIIYKILNYCNDLNIKERMDTGGWRDINKEILLFTDDYNKWMINNKFYKAIRWTIAGYKIIETRNIVDLIKVNICHCGFDGMQELPYTCKIKNCRCGYPKKLTVEAFTCSNCGINPRKAWTIPI